MTQRRVVERVIALCLAAFVLGVVDSLIKGNGHGLIGALSRTAAPWLLLSFLGGALASRRSALVGAVAGLATTYLALIGFYLVNSLLFRYDSMSWLADIRHALGTGRTYFVLATLSGPLLGALGTWWRQHLSMIPVICLGLVFVLEALEQAAVARLLVDYSVQAAAIEAVAGALWTVFALNLTRFLRRSTVTADA